MRSRFSPGTSDGWSGPWTDEARQRVTAPATPTPVPTAAPTPAPANDEVTNLRLSSDAAGALTITWDAPSSAPADYRISWARDDLSWLSWDAADETHRGSSYPVGADTSLTLTGLTVGETYKARMRSRYNPGTSDGRSGPWTDEATQLVRGDDPDALTTKDEPTLDEPEEGLIALPQHGDTPTNPRASVKGSSLTLTYDMALDTDSPPNSAFAVIVNDTRMQPSQIAISDMTVTLTLVIPVPAGAKVFLDYTVPSTDPIQTPESQGTPSVPQDAEALTNLVVQNNTGLLVSNFDIYRSGRKANHHGIIPITPLSHYSPRADLLDGLRVAQSFRTGSDTDGYQLGIVRLDMEVMYHEFTGDPYYEFFGKDRNIPRVSIRSDSSGSPGGILQTLVGSRTLSQHYNDFYAKGVTLTANTTYWIVVENTRIINYYPGIARGCCGPQLGGTYSKEENSLSATGWSIGDGVKAQWLDGSWSFFTLELPNGDRAQGAVKKIMTLAVFESALASEPFFKDHDGNGESDLVILRIAENAPAGTSVGTIPFTNLDDDTLTFSVTGGESSAFNTKFTLHPGTGVITLKPGASLDYDTKNSYKIEVSVTDGEDGFGSSQSPPEIDDTVTVDVLVEDS